MRLAGCIKIQALLVLFLAAGRTEAGFNLSITPGNNGTLQFGYVLVGDTASGQVTVKNPSTTASESVTFPAASGPFGGAGGTTSIPKKGSASSTYTFAPTQRGVSTEALKVTGSQGGSNASATVTLKGQGVAPVEQVSASGAGLTRIGTTNPGGQVTIKNIGNGDLAGSGSHYNLNGSVGALTAGPFSAGTPTFSLKDGGQLTMHYFYTPIGHGKDTASLGISFSDGSSDGKNAAQNVLALLGGQGVGPIFHSSLAAGSLTDFGKVSVGKKALEPLAISNISTDPNNGWLALTSLSLFSYTVTGPNANLFSLSGFKPGPNQLGFILDEGKSKLFQILFQAKGPAGHKYATLTVMTDQGAASGKAGQTFSYNLTATVVPEPSSIALVASAACALLGYGRLRRRAARSA